MINIVIIEDHPLVRFNLQIGLKSESAFKTFGSFASCKDFYASTDLKQVHLILLDINLPDVDGYTILKDIKTTNPQIKIIGISSFEDKQHIKKFMNLGGEGYVIKGSSNTVLITAIKEVMAGKVFLCEKSQKYLLETDEFLVPSFNLTKLENQIIEVLKKFKIIDLNIVCEEVDLPLDKTKLVMELLIQKIEFYEELKNEDLKNSLQKIIDEENTFV